MPELTLGVVGTSRKRDEHRLPIHPRHLGRIDADLRRRIFLERGYGRRFDVSDAQLAREVGGMLSREELLEECDVTVLPKPLPEDLADLPHGKVVWGWPHCVQDEAMTDVAIDRRLTLIAWEAMNHWTEDGELQPPRLPQEQRAGGVLLGAPRAGAGGHDGGLRPAPARGRDQLRRDRPRRRDARCLRSACTT